MMRIEVDHQDPRQSLLFRIELRLEVSHSNGHVVEKTNAIPCQVTWWAIDAGDDFLLSGINQINGLFQSANRTQCRLQCPGREIAWQEIAFESLLRRNRTIQVEVFLDLRTYSGS